MWLKHKRDNFSKFNKPYALDNGYALGLGLNCNGFDQEEETLYQVVQKEII